MAEHLCGLWRRQFDTAVQATLEFLAAEGDTEAQARLAAAAPKESSPQADPPEAGAAAAEPPTAGEPPVQSWHRLMASDMPKAKYSNAVRRILQEEPQRYLACAYRDAATAFPEGPAPAAGVDLRRAHDALPAGAARSAFWQLVGAANQAAAAWADHTPQRVPTRAEIEENIRRHRQDRDRPAGSQRPVPEAFVAALLEAARLVGGEAADAFAAHLQAADAAELLAAWGQMMRTEPELEARCRDADAEALQEAEWSGVPEPHRELFRGGMRAPGGAPGLCKLLTRANTLARVNSSVPKGMMGQIEQYAMRLADELQSGKLDMNSLSLEQIGKDVLSGCDAGDMRALVGSLDDLLPSLQALQQ